jgi:adenylate cyclase
MRVLVEPTWTHRWRKGDPNRQSLSRELQDKPSIAVLPFINMSGDPEREYFADGLVEITALNNARRLNRGSQIFDG